MKKPSKETADQNRLSLKPTSDTMNISSRLQKHAKEMTPLVADLLKTKSITPEKSDFLSHLEALTSIVHADSPTHAPGEMSLYLLCKNLKTYDLFQFFTEAIHRILLPWHQGKVVSTKQLNFTFDILPKKEFFVSEVIIHIDDNASLQFIKNKISHFFQEISLGALSPQHARQLLLSKGFTQEHKMVELNKMIVELANGRLKLQAADLFIEMHHFLASCDDEFRRLRHITHMTRLISTFYWFRKTARNQLRQDEKGERSIKFKLFKTALQFTFGEKKVLGLAITISHLNEYEQFEAKHILRSCQRIFPSIRIVPHSYLHYENPSDSIVSFYLEIEKKDGKDFSLAEIKLLYQGLKIELPLAIEQLSHKLFMPHNEEEVLRNILILSQELRTVQDPPQIIVNFRGQTENSLTFHVILVRILQDEQTVSFEKLFEHSSDFLTFVSGTKKIVNHLKNKYPKEANTFLLECPKQPFLRQDHSVDLLRAREFIVSSVKRMIGDVRDYNGGLIGQQNQLLNGLKEILSPTELKQELYLENLFHSITPVLMKSLLAPELIRTLFQLFIALKDEINEDSSEFRYKEERLNNALVFIVGADERAFFEPIEKVIQRSNCKELEVATTSFKVGNTYYQGYIISPQELEILDKLSPAIKECISRGKNKGVGQTLRISLPRPTSLLDPRIGTDRTSGIVIKMLYEGLTRIDLNGKPSPAVAERIEISQDQKTYTFYLRQTQWSNGMPVTAYDFEYAWKKLLDPQFKTLYAYLLYSIKNAKAAKTGVKPLSDVGIHVKGPYILSVELEHPAPYFIELTSHWIYSPLCKTVDEAYPGWAYYGGEHFVCNGPFRLAKWKRNSDIQAVKNPLYWDAEFVHLKKIDISIIEDAQEAFQKYQKDELDWIGEPLSEIPPETFKKKSFNEKIFSLPISAVHWYACNVAIAPFTSKKCRQALAYALCRHTLIDEILQGGEQPAYSILPPSLSTLSSPLFADNNKALAKQLFEEGLKEQGLTLETVPKINITCFDVQLHEALAQAVARQWKETLGIEIGIETFTWDRFINKCLAYDFHLMSSTWYSWFNDPLYNLNLIKHSQGDLNATQWQNETYISTLNQACECTDMKARKQFLKDAEILAMDEMPIIPLFYYTFKYMKKEHVNNIFLSHLGQIDFKWAYINKQK